MVQTSFIPLITSSISLVLMRPQHNAGGHLDDTLWIDLHDVDPADFENECRFLAAKVSFLYLFLFHDSLYNSGFMIISTIKCLNRQRMLPS
jgi:hypothetical protein